MKAKTIGGIMMLLGTCVGAGMLALPIAAAHEGFLMAAALLIICWLTMTFGALNLLEVNLSLPENNNLISMADKTLGKAGKYLTWFIYLLLLYSLMAAYISGSSNIIYAITQATHIKTPAWLNTLIAVIILSSIVYKGAGSVDIVNRFLMSAKFISYIIIVLAIIPFIKISNLSYLNNLNYLNNHKYFNINININTIMVMITSFGYAIIIPTLRSYFKSDIKQLKKVILIGSAVPLIIYILWIAVIQGLIPKLGDHGLLYIAKSQQTNATLMKSINIYINQSWISIIANIFISICAITSLLGVSLCLTDFIADGCNLNKKFKKHNRFIYLITFAPPTIIVLFAPGIFINALGYAGICCILLLVILPIVMSLSRIYIKKSKTSYIAPGGSILKIIFLIIAIILLSLLFIQK